LLVVEKKVVELVKAVKNEEAKQYVTDYTTNFANAAMKRWKKQTQKLNL
jgi:hypothetical protein